MATNFLPNSATERTPNHFYQQLTSNPIERPSSLFLRLSDLETDVALAHATTQTDLAWEAFREDGVMVRHTHQMRWPRLSFRSWTQVPPGLEAGKQTLPRSCWTWPRQSR